MVLPQIGTRERLSLYASTIGFQWLAAVVVAWRAWARGLSLEELGLVVHGRWRILIAAIVGAATLGGLQWLNLRRMGRSSGKAREFMQVLAERILPQSRLELVPFLALAVTAGLCEEFLYRGFAMAALTRAGLPSWGVVLLSSVLFGLAHLYQGRGGLVEHTGHWHSIRNGANRVRWVGSGDGLAFCRGCGGGSGGAEVPC